MNKEFIPYQESLELKELGFDEECLAWHNGVRLFIDNYNAINSKMYFDYCCSIPLYQQVFRWFREKYNLKSCIMFRTSMEDNKEYYDWLIKGQEVVYRHFNTYEEAELECLKKLIEIVQNK